MASITQIFEKHASEIAAVILEPIVQGAGGMRFYHPTYLSKLRILCDQFDILLIVDEIATGFGRAGRHWLASSYANISPDIICLGKALTGGYLSFAATISSSKVAETVCRGPSGVLMHGPTFMGNPLACSVAHANLDLLESSDWRFNVSRIEQQLKLELIEPCQALVGKTVHDVRVLGAIGVVELKTVPQQPAALQRFLVTQGVWLRPYGKLLYTMPSYIIEPDQLRQITRAMVRAARRRW